MSAEERPGFLARWSRLKRGAAREPEAPPEAVPEAEDEPFDLSLLPDLASLTAESDVSLFLHQAVPEALRHAALRRIWLLDPAIRDFVGRWTMPGTSTPPRASPASPNA